MPSRIDELKLLKQKQGLYEGIDEGLLNEQQQDLAKAYLTIIENFSSKLTHKSQSSLKIEIASMSSLSQMQYYFSDIESITCPISCVATINPVKLIYDDEGKDVSQQVFDGTVISSIIKKQGKCPLTRKDVISYKEGYLPPFLEELKQIAAKNICNKADILENDQKIVAEFIDNYLLLNLDIDNIIISGCSLLYTAAKFGLADHVTKLLNKGANPDQSQGFSFASDHHFLPIGVCATLNHANVAEALLTHKDNPANVNATPDNGEFLGVSASYFACRYSHLETLKVLVAHGAVFDESASYNGVSALYDAVTRKDLAAIKEILNSTSVQIDQFQTKENGHKGLTALYLAVHEGYTDIVKLLLSKGANPYVKQGNGEFKDKTIFDIALHDDETELKALIENIKLKEQRSSTDRTSSLHSINTTRLTQLPPVSRVVSLRPSQGRMQSSPEQSQINQDRRRGWR